MQEVDSSNLLPVCLSLLQLHQTFPEAFGRHVVLVPVGFKFIQGSRLITIHALEPPCTASVSSLHLEDGDRKTRPWRRLSWEKVKCLVKKAETAGFGVLNCRSALCLPSKVFSSWLKPSARARARGRALRRCFSLSVSNGPHRGGTAASLVGMEKQL